MHLHDQLQPRRRGKLRHELTAVLAVLVVVGIASAYLLADGVLIGQDAATQFYPWYGYLGEQLRSGYLPEWNPSQFAGAPFAADPQSGWMYVPAMLLFTLLPRAAAIGPFLVVHLLLAGLGTYALARLIGIGRMGAVIAATAYMGTGAMLGRMPCCPASYQIVSWVSIVLAGTEVAIQARTARCRVAGWVLSGFGVSQALGAWLGQGSYYVLLLTVAYLAYRVLLDPPPVLKVSVGWQRRVRLLSMHGIVILVVGFGLAAAGILPRLEYNVVSTVAGGVYQGSGVREARIGGASFEDVFGRLFRPSLYYPGVVTLALAVAGIVLGWRRRTMPFWLGLVAVTIVLSTPTMTPLHRIVYLLPRFVDLHTHWPERVILIAYIAPVLLAGLVVSELGQQHSRSRVVGAAITPIVIAAALLAIGTKISQMVGIAIVGTSLLILVGGFSRQLANRGVIPAIIVVVLIVDIGTATLGLARDAPFGGYHRVDPQSFYAATDAAEFLRSRQVAEDSPFRYAGYDPAIQTIEDGEPVFYRYQFAEPATRSLLVNNRATTLGLEDVQGYNPVQLASYADYVTVMNGTSQEYHSTDLYPGALSSPLLNLLNVRYLVVPAELPPDRPDLLRIVRKWELVHADQEVRVLENPEALPRAWLVHDVRQMSRAESLESLAAGSVNPREVALVGEQAQIPPLSEPDPDAKDEVTMVATDDPDTMQVRTRSSAAGLLVLSEVNYPAWQATIDGRPVSVLTVNGIFRGVPVPAGDHLVELRFVSDAMRTGLTISLITTVVILVALVATWWPRRRQLSNVA
jgi:hypothetical protein